ncbi:MAG TPA: ATP-binding protein [Myxococcaceae bacterium]|nr:ATP-binding protein [Myxococcaceae bacterium]
MSPWRQTIGTPRVLLVDDNPALTENLDEILQASGYSVKVTASCAAALEAGRGGFDVALVDFKLPDGEGTALAPQLKELMPDGEVVLLTGFATVESAAAAVRAGAFAYLVKPCATRELLLTLEQALRQVALHREKNELARRAQTSEKLAAVGTLTAGLSHEIRNPLNAAGLQLSVLERRVRKLPSGEQEPLLQPLLLVRDEIRRLDRILEDFLSFARPRELMARPVEVGPLLARMMALLEGDAVRRGVKLESAFPSNDALVVPGDADRLQQVIVNLALNALDAVPQGGWVRLGASALPNGQVLIYVEDNGPGIPAELRERIFEPFFTTKPHGSGLGLSIVHSIVIQHGGTLKVEQASGGGARFVMRLPAMGSANGRS